MTRMSTSCSRRCVAKLCRSVCGDTRFLIPAAWAAARTARLSWRTDSGSTGLRPGNSQPPVAAGSAAAPPATRRAAVRAAAATASRGGPPPSRGQALAPLAALDAQQHAFGIDIADLERDNLRDAQPGAVCGGERCLVLRPCCRSKQQRDLLDAEHRRYPPRLRHDGKAPRQIRPVERHREEEAQGRDRTV